MGHVAGRSLGSGWVNGSGLVGSVEGVSVGASLSGVSTGAAILNSSKPLVGLTSIATIIPLFIIITETTSPKKSYSPTHQGFSEHQSLPVDIHLGINQGEYPFDK
jgi:hypothetical protein